MLIFFDLEECLVWEVLKIIMVIVLFRIDLLKMMVYSFGLILYELKIVKIVIGFVVESVVLMVMVLVYDIFSFLGEIVV